MQAQVDTDEDQRVMEFTRQVNGAGDEIASRDVYREAFKRLRLQLTMYPVASPSASATFESAANTVRNLAARCLPLAIAVSMHLYPLCALQCVPLPLLSPARFKRVMLLRTIRSRSLILANAGSERAQGADQPLIATSYEHGIRIDGTYEYVSLASVADIVFFKAKLADSDCAVLCAADLRADSVRIGKWKFSGSMRLSDTSSATFVDHRVPHGRYMLVPNDDRLGCVSDYQRCWFHLFLAEIYLARLAHLQRAWGLSRSADHIVSLNEMSRLREYSLHLLDHFSPGSDIEPLTKTTSALKLRVSLLTQSTVAALRSLDAPTAADARQLASDASELCFIKSQPTADEKILRSLGVS
ncbi:MAG: hypothetical protein ACREV5_01085 [Steroidobacter sp.]